MVNLHAVSCFKTSHDELRCSRIELLLDLPGVPYDLALKTFSKSFPLNNYLQSCRYRYGFHTGSENEARRAGSVVGGSVVGGSEVGGSVVGGSVVGGSEAGGSVVGGSVVGGSVVLLNQGGAVVGIAPHVGPRRLVR